MKLLMIPFFFLWSAALLAQDPPAVLKRVGGDYVVSDIKKNKDGSFEIVFESKTKTGKYDILRLHSDHVHFAVRKNQTLRISAEILSQTGRITEISQVLLFLPTDQGVDSYLAAFSRRKKRINWVSFS